MELGNVYLTNFLVDGEPINCHAERFSIPYSQNSFTLEFSLLNYKNTDNISFQYRINEGKWNSTNEGVNAISFNKLNPGKYIIEVRAAGNGSYSKHITTITVVVKDPWYASPLAYITYILIFISLLA